MERVPPWRIVSGSPTPTASDKTKFHLPQSSGAPPDYEKDPGKDSSTGGDLSSQDTGETPPYFTPEGFKRVPQIFEKPEFFVDGAGQGDLVQGSNCSADFDFKLMPRFRCYRRLLAHQRDGGRRYEAQFVGKALCCRA